MEGNLSNTTPRQFTGKRSTDCMCCCCCCCYCLLLLAATWDCWIIAESSMEVHLALKPQQSPLNTLAGGCHGQVGRECDVVLCSAHKTKEADTRHNPCQTELTPTPCPACTFPRPPCDFAPHVPFWFSAPGPSADSVLSS